MDPWLSYVADVTTIIPDPDIPITKFEDNFAPITRDNLPDSEQYLELLEQKLRKIKDDPDILAQLAAKRESCMHQLICGTEQVNIEIEDINLDQPVQTSQILRTLAPQKQALNQGELVELVKYDQLKDIVNDAEVILNSAEKSIEKQ